MSKKNSSETARVKSPHAAAAQAIRQDLKKAFPGVKFKVRSNSFSMGNSVDVDWTDGPTRSEVDRIIGRYQYGHFDGMQDLYEYTNRRDDIPQAKYVSGSRSMSEEVRADLLKYIIERFFNPDEREGVTENTRMPWGHDYVQTYVYREFAERSYTTPAQWMPEEREGVYHGGEAMKPMDEKQAAIAMQVDLARRVWCRPDWERVITTGSSGDGVGGAIGFRFANAGEYKVGDKIDDGYGLISTVVCII